MSDRFPVIYSLLSPKALVADFLPEYDLGEVTDCKLYNAGFNDTYVVETGAGAIYYLRVYRRRWRTLADVRYELEALVHLRRKGVPVAWPLPRRDGSLYGELPAPEGPRYAALFVKAPGREISYDEDAEGMAFRYGQAVASIHNAMSDFRSRHERFHLDLEHLIDTPLRNVEPFLSHRAEDWAYVQRFAATVRQQIVDLPADELEWGFCHGDLQAFHANIDDDGTLTFYDFDCGGFGYRAYELAVFRWSARFDDLEAVWSKPYLRGYRTQRQVNDLDVEAIPLFICARHIWHMGAHTSNADDWGYGSLGDKYFDRRLQWLRELEADYLTGGLG